MEVVSGCSQYGGAQLDDAIALRLFVMFKKDGSRRPDECCEML